MIEILPRLSLLFPASKRRETPSSRLPVNRKAGRKAALPGLAVLSSGVGTCLWPLNEFALVLIIFVVEFSGGKEEHP